MHDALADDEAKMKPRHWQTVEEDDVVAAIMAAMLLVLAAAATGAVLWLMA